MALASACGADGSAAFEARPGSGAPHSAMARAILARYVVGVLGEAEVEKVGVFPLGSARWQARSRSRYVGAMPSTHITPGSAVDLEVGHAISADANVWVGVAHGVADVMDVSFGHATWTGESDLALRGHLAGDLFAGALVVGGGYRFQGVPEGDGPGMFSELVVAVQRPWLTVGLVPGVAFLPASESDALRVGGGLTVGFHPMNLLSFYGEARTDLLDPGAPHWAGGLRFHTWAHTFTLGATSSLALAPLERLATNEAPGFAVNLSLSRQFGPSPD